MISILSPAKNLNSDPYKGGSELTKPELKHEADYLMGKLKHLSARQIGKLMNLSPALADLNFERYQQWQEDPSDDHTKPALHIFAGEVYRQLNAADFSDKDEDFAQDHLRILSGLYGVLKPMDLIQEYRLEMGTSFKVTAKKKNLYQYWGSTLAETLDGAMEGHKHPVIINLASNEYVKAVDRKALKSQMIDCQFLDFKNGDYRSVMTWAKQARGGMAREIIKNQLDNPDQLKEVSFNGYHFDPKRSTENNLVYLRNAQ